MCLTPNEKPGHQDSGELSWLAVLCMCYHASLLGEASTVCTTPQRGVIPNLVAGLSQTLPYGPFSPAYLMPYLYMQYTKSKSIEASLGSVSSSDPLNLSWEFPPLVVKEISRERRTSREETTQTSGLDEALRVSLA